MRRIVLLLVGVLATSAGTADPLHASVARGDREPVTLDADAPALAGAALRAPSAFECVRLPSRESNTPTRRAADPAPLSQTPYTLGATLSELSARHLANGGIDASHLGTPPPHIRIQL